MIIKIEIDTSRAGFLHADELEKFLETIGERITNGRYQCDTEPYTFATSSGITFGTVELKGQ